VPLDFTAVDFETANGSNASACAVGLTKVRDGEIVDRMGWLIKPPPGHDHFAEWNIRIHGITADMVEGASTWVGQFTDLLDYIDDDLVVAHNAGFDMGVIRGACLATAVEPPELGYVCSLQVARRSYRLESYRLPVVAAAAGVPEFDHHDAVADATACAGIMIDAASRYGAMDLPELAAMAGVRIGRLAPLSAARIA